ncbi:MAG: EMC3/TMCO1 family protein [Nanoarchaeota archaeon]
MKFNAGAKKYEPDLDKIKEDAEKDTKIIPENKKGKISSLLQGKNKEGSFKPIIFIMIVSIGIAMFWDKIPYIKDSVHAVLDPTVGFLLNLNLIWGMIFVVLVISFLTTIVQKYATDQKALKELRKEQKILQEEMKKYKEHPEKMAELSKKQFEFIPKTFKLTSRAIMFTGIPFILFFRWFNDFFTAIGDPKFFGFLSWFWFYLIFTMIFSSIFRKVLKVV